MINDDIDDLDEALMLLMAQGLIDLSVDDDGEFTFFATEKGIALQKERDEAE